MLAGCVDPPEEAPELGAATFASVSSQGTTYQGTTYQGTTYQGTTYQGASYGGVAGTAQIGSKTSLEIWRWVTILGKWEQRTPNARCYWDAGKTSSSCTTVDPGPLTVSPLAGAQLEARFYDPVTDTLRAGTLRIGASTTAKGAVLKDDGVTAMHPLIGQGAGPVSSVGCTNTRGCASNSDLFLYDVELLDPTVGAVKFCPPGEKAYALAGTWGANGAYSASTTQFTFACTSGTIAKCTRWGYRPFGSAQLSDGATMVPLADYHQACIRAAMADYCADGRSFTRNGTPIDIYDYTPGSGNGLVPRTAGTAPAFLWESGFDKAGAYRIERTRYQELNPNGNDPVQPLCWGRTHEDELSDGSMSWPNVSTPIYIDSMNGCRHSESITGRGLDQRCSDCAARVISDSVLGRPSCEGSAWDSQCVALANQLCKTEPRLTKHDECTTGVALGKANTACTWDVCSDPTYAGCCTSGWTSTCTAVANRRCTGGREHADIGGNQYGFCGVVLPPVVQL